MRAGGGDVTARRFRKRPVEVDAALWDGTVSGATDVITWVLNGGGTARYHGARPGDALFAYAPPYIAVDTPDSTGRVFAGDWVIRGAAGDFYPCKPDIFAATYDEVGAETPPQPNLGLATTRQLLDEITARIETDHASGGGGLDYTTVKGRPVTAAD